MAVSKLLDNLERQLQQLQDRQGANSPSGAVALGPEIPVFAEQTAFILDAAKLKAVFCTRRSGKSFGDGLYLFKTALEIPGSTSLYVALTRESAKKIMWRPILKRIDRQFKIGARFNETELSISLRNGSVIYLMGVDSDEDQKSKILGQSLALAIIDECGSFTIDLTELVFSVLKPACADVRGTIVLSGVPTDLKKGIFYDLTKDQDPSNPGTWSVAGWSGHRWSAFQNPYVRENWAKEITDLESQNPRVRETPWFRKNYLGLWTTDTSKLVYRYEPGLNDWSGTLPEYRKGAWHYSLGVDLGHTDPSAFTVCTWHDYDPVLRILESSKQAKMDVTAVADRIKLYLAKFPAIERVIIDNANKQATAEIENRHGIALTPADKRGKSDFIEIMNSEFATGKVLLNPATCQPLITEYQELIWDPKSTKREEHPSCPNHCTDATLYAWRYTYSYLSETLEHKPQPGTPEFYKRNYEQEIADHWAAEERVLDEKHREENDAISDFFDFHRSEF